MEDSQAASILCQAVFDGDVLQLRRLVRAGIQVNASDYEKRTAAHIAAAEGNLAALKVLVEYGADLSLQDRWGNSVDDEAKREGSAKILDFLKTAKSDAS
jgi:ankyrin repeat protein